MRYIYWMVLICSLAISACGQVRVSPDAQTKEDIKVGSFCEICDLMFEGMPSADEIKSVTKIAPENEPGEKMLITGTVFQKDGKTPAKDVILYIYHTDHRGEYSQAKGQAHGKRNGHLRGWVKTEEDGSYSFVSIRPAAYPVRKFPAHIHIVVKEPGKTAYYIDEVWFDDDNLLTAEMKNRAEKRGGDMLMHLEKDASDTWKGNLNITLGMNIPNYR